MKENTIVEFGGKQAVDVALTGGKGSSLARMFQAGIPVPKGFVVATAALDQFLAENYLSQQIDERIKHLRIDDEVGIQNASEFIRAMILDATVLPDLERGIQGVLQSQSLRLVAVRSSATSEDSDKDSWAGELETYLNTTQETLIHNVKRCWASLFSERAITYRLEKGMQNKAISVAVVIQEMVQSDVSGVCFTVHPVSGQRHIMLIEAVWGLGEAIVSGQVTPDAYTYEKNFEVVLRTVPASQEKLLALGKKRQGIEWMAVHDKDASRQKLDYRQIQALANICKQVETYYGSPQDIEWAVSGDLLYIVQSRPITTLG